MRRFELVFPSAYSRVIFSPLDQLKTEENEFSYRRVTAGPFIL